MQHDIGTAGMIVRCYIQLFWNASWFTWTIEREHSFNDCKQTAFSHMLVCPNCHRIWAKILFEKDRICWPKAQFCEHCQIIEEPWHPVPGSLLLQEGWDVVDESLIAALPPELLQREFDLSVKALEIGDSQRERPARLPDTSDTSTNVGPLALSGC